MFYPTFNSYNLAMDWRYKLLRIDSQAGITVGMVALLLSNWLDAWYQLPQNFIYFLALANIAYGCYSFSLLIRKKRPKILIMLLIVANLTWAFLCLRWVIVFSKTANSFGLAHLLLEALFVGGLACLEWRWRELLITNPTRS